MTGMDHNFAASMTRRYLLALGILAAIAMLSDYLLQQKLAEERSRSAVVNLCGRQRMLCQRIAFLVQRMVAEAGSPSTAERQQLRVAIDEMSNALHALLHGDPDRHIPAPPSPEIAALYFGQPQRLAQELRDYLQAARTVCELPAEQLDTGNPTVRYVLQRASAPLPIRLDELVARYQAEGERGIANLQHLERTVMLITLIILLLMVLFIFRPMVQQIRRHLDERERLIHDLKTALAKVKTLRGLIPICADCKKIRDDRGYWTQLEEYLQNHSEAGFTHGLCPECQRRFEDGEH